MSTPKNTQKSSRKSPTKTNTGNRNISDSNVADHVESQNKHRSTNNDVTSPKKSSSKTDGANRESNLTSTQRRPIIQRRTESASTLPSSPVGSPLTRTPSNISVNIASIAANKNSKAEGKTKPANRPSNSNQNLTTDVGYFGFPKRGGYAVSPTLAPGSAVLSSAHLAYSPNIRSPGLDYDDLSIPEDRGRSKRKRLAIHKKNTNYENEDINDSGSSNDSSPASSGSTAGLSSRAASLSESTMERNGINSEIIQKEVAHVASLSWPVSLGYLIQMLIPMGQIYSMGHQEETTALSGTALAVTICNVTGFAVGVGLNTALDTLCSQAFTGSSDKYALGKHLQRGLLIIFLACFPIAFLWFHLEPILLWANQPPDSSAIAASVIRYMTIGLFPILLNDSLKRYCQSQGIVLANLCVVLIATPVSFLLQWLFVFSPWFQYGHNGAAFATSLTYVFVAVLDILYIVFIDGYQCWGGFSLKEMFDVSQLKDYLKLALPGMFMTCTEWWAFETLVLASGWIGDTELAAQTILIETASLTYTLPFGISVGATTRVGNLLGQGRPLAARAASYVALVLGFFEALTLSSILLFARGAWSAWWSSNKVVSGLVYNVLPILLCFQFGDSLNAVSSGILRGCGKQSFGAAINLVGYYGIGIPVSMYLAFKHEMKLHGLWLGMFIGVVLVSLIQIIVVGKLNWLKEVHRTKRVLLRSERKFKKAYSDEEQVNNEDRDEETLTQDSTDNEDEELEEEDENTSLLRPQVSITNYN